MKLKVGKISSVVLDPELRGRVQEFVDNAAAFSSISEAIRVLIVRGLYLSEKPRGRLSEVAWASAYFASKASILKILRRDLLGPKFETFIKEAFDEALRES